MIDLTRESPSPLRTSTPRRNLERILPDPIDLSPETLSADITQFDIPGSPMSAAGHDIQDSRSPSPPPVPDERRLRPRVTFAPLVEERFFSNVNAKEKLPASRPRSKDESQGKGKTVAGMSSACSPLTLIQVALTVRQLHQILPI